MLLLRMPFEEAADGTDHNFIDIKLIFMNTEKQNEGRDRGTGPAFTELQQSGDHAIN
jgi:hypothetical protein